MESPKKDRKRELEGVADKWLTKDYKRESWKERETSGKCFHCGSDAHRAFECPHMLDEARDLNAEMLSREIKRLAGAWLFCKLCFKQGKGFNVFDPETNKKRVAYGWGNHTVQKCRLNTTGIDPSKPEKMNVKKAKGDGKVIDVEAEEEKEKEPKGYAGGSAKPNIFKTPEGLVIPNPKWGEESTKPKPEEKKMPKKTKESKDKEKKEKKDKKQKKEKKEKDRRAIESPEKQSYSERDLTNTE